MLRSILQALLLASSLLVMLPSPAFTWQTEKDAKLQKMGQQQVRGARPRTDVKCKALDQYTSYCTNACKQVPWNCGKDKHGQVLDNFLGNKTVFSLSTNNSALQYGCGGIVVAPLYYNISLKTSSVGVVIIYREEDQLVVTVKMNCPYMIVPQPQMPGVDLLAPNTTAQTTVPGIGGSRRLLAKANAINKIGANSATATAPQLPAAKPTAQVTSSLNATVGNTTAMAAPAPPRYDPMAAIGLTWGWKAPYADPRTWQYQDFLATDRYFSGFTYRINLIDVCGPGFIWSTKQDTCLIRFTRMQRQPQYEDFTLKKRHNVAVSIMVAPVQFKNGVPHATEEAMPATNHIQSSLLAGVDVASFKSFAIPDVDWPGYISLHDPVKPARKPKGEPGEVMLR